MSGLTVFESSFTEAASTVPGQWSASVPQVPSLRSCTPTGYKDFSCLYGKMNAGGVCVCVSVCVCVCVCVCRTGRVGHDGVGLVDHELRVCATTTDQLIMRK